MMHHEFEQIAGYEVSYEDYHNIIEPMYMATNLSKQEFVKVIDEKRFSIQYKKAQLKKSLLKQMKEIAQIMKDYCGHRDTYEEYILLKDLAKQYIEEFGEVGTTADWERGYEYTGHTGCSYIKAIVFTSKYTCEEVSRVNLVA